MKTIVASRNPELAHDFARELLRRSDLRLVVADTTRELLAALGQGAQLCFLDRLMPDGSGAEALADIRADQRLESLPVVLVTSPGAPHGTQAEARTLGFDEVLELPAQPGTLSLLVGRLLGVPLRDSDRRAVHVSVYRVRDGAPEYLGASEDLSERGMLLRAAPQCALEVGGTLTLQLQLPGQSEILRLGAVVVRRDDRSFAPAHGLALSFTDVTTGDRQALHRFLSDLLGAWPFRWRLERDGERQQVALSGTITLDTDLAPLFALRGPVDFRLPALHRIEAEAVKRWHDLLERFGPGGVRLLECSVPFVQQAAVLPSLTGGAEIISFLAPYSCPACGLDDERLVESASLGRERRPPEFPCRACRGPLRFDEIPEGYFAAITAS